MRTIPSEAIAIVKEFEGFRAVGYLCPAGVPTAGWGHTGPEVQVGKKYSVARCEDWLEADLRVAHKKLAAVVGESVIDALNDNQYSALLSFVFNLGASRDWQIWKAVKRSQFDMVPPQLMRFVNAGGRRLPGLVRRRAAESALWVKADEDFDVPTSSTLRAPDMTPPTPVPMSPQPLITAAVGTVAAVPVAAQQVQAAVAPYADASPVVGQVIAVVATIAAAAAVLLLALTWLQRRNSKK